MTAATRGESVASRTHRNWMSSVLPTAAVAGVALLLLTTLLITTGHDPRIALGALWNGAFGSWYQLSSVTLVRMVPLALTGLAVAIAFRAGVLNIGAEGQLLVGAAVATALGLSMKNAPSIVAISAMLTGGAVAGALWAGIATLLRRRFGVLEVISTIMLNFIALYLTGYLIRGPLQEPTHIYPQSATIPSSQNLPIVLPGSRLHLGFVVAVVLAASLWWWLRFSASGFRVRAVGMNANAAAIAGRINVERTTALAFLLSGALAGLAGAVELTGSTYALYENFSPGYGYSAIAVALLARLNPMGVLASAFLFGALDAGATAMQRDAAVPSVVVLVVNAVLILGVVTVELWHSRSVSSEGGA